MSGSDGGGFDPAEPHLRPAAPRASTAAPAPADAGEAPSLAWERRQSAGHLEAFAGSLWRLAARPARAFAALPAGGGWRSPWLFAVACWGVLGTLSELVDGLSQALLAGRMPGGDLAQLFQIAIGGRSFEWLSVSLLSITGCLFGLLLAVPLMILFGSGFVLLWSGVLHLILWLTGGLRGSVAGFEGTFRAVCFGQAGMLGAPLPLIGDLVALFWSLGLQSAGVARMHGCGRIHSAVVVLAPWMVLLVAIVLLELLSPG